MKSKKVVINKCFGGFGLSHKAVMRYAELKGMTLYPWIDDITKEVYGPDISLEDASAVHYTTVPKAEYDEIYAEEYKKPIDPKRFVKSNSVYFSERDIPRDDPDLVRIVEEMGEGAGDRYAELEVVEIPADVSYTVEEYDGLEHIAEEHRTWG